MLLGCAFCEVRFAWPLTVPPNLYEAIYRASGQLGGYTRYERYARSVEVRKNPLNYLAEQEDMYWAVKHELAGATESSKLRIVEVGSGLGYLTRALNVAGYECVGLDISPTAVQRATARFGPHFRQQDIFNPDDDLLRSFDLVIMLETIEHVVNPQAFLQAALNLLRPRGRILLSTPNKDIYPSGSIWKTDLPPVHLFWFGERAISILADSVGASASFVDFSKFNERHPQTVLSRAVHEVGKPYLSRSYLPIGRLSVKTRFMEQLRQFPVVARAVRSVHDRVQGGGTRLSASSFSLAAVISHSTIESH